MDNDKKPGKLFFAGATYCIDYCFEDNTMMFFDPHIHMYSRTTDDYQAMADAVDISIFEPAAALR